MRTRRRDAGFTLMELLVVAMLAGLLVTAGVPSLGRVAETGQVDSGAAGLRSIWRGQRMHWLEHGSYADDLRDLEAEHFIDTALISIVEPFRFAILSGEADSFSASAVRAGSSLWSGTLLIDETGRVTGSVSDGAGHVLSPSS